jgi:hypothetical protein
MIKIWAVELTDAESKKTETKVFFGNYAQANRYAHNKSKSSASTVSRVFEMDADILKERQVAFHIGNAKLSLDKGGVNG